MLWNPEKYNQFKHIRYQPFFDLMRLISDDTIKETVDIGCGTGEQTRILSENFKSASFLGIDSSAQMLSEAFKFEHERLTFRMDSIETFADSNTHWDLIFSNAALQWVDNHHQLFPKLISKLNNNGQFAIQMPVQNENLLNVILTELVQEKPFVDFLQGWTRPSSVLSIDQYGQIMFRAGLQNIQIFQKVYPIIAEHSQKLLDFISSTTLIPYLERLSEEEQYLLMSEFKIRIERAFKPFPAIYAFKRLLLYGKSLLKRGSNDNGTKSGTKQSKKRHSHRNVSKQV